MKNTLISIGWIIVVSLGIILTSNSNGDGASICGYTRAIHR